MTNTYNSQGQTLTQTDGLGGKTQFFYTGNVAQPTSNTRVTDPDGDVSVYDYSNYGLLSSVTRGSGTSESATWTYAYNEASNPDQVTTVADPAGHITRYTYDSDGNVLTQTDPYIKTTTNTYDGLDDLLTMTDPDGVTTTNTYQPPGDLVTSSTPVGGGTTATTRYSHIVNGDLQQITDPNGHTTTLEYDANGNLVIKYDPLGGTTTETHNAAGELTSLTTADGNAYGGNPAGHTTTYTYDAAGHVLTETDPKGNVTAYTYDADGNQTQVNAAGRVTKYTYDASSQLVKTTRPDGSTLINSYDPDGLLLSQVNGEGGETDYTYDALKRLTSRTIQDGNAGWEYGYDPNGNLTSETDPEGRTITYGYDADNRLTGLYASGLGAHDATYAYDADGRRVSMNDASGTTNYTYDGLGRLTSETNGAAQRIAYAYDLDGDPTTLTYPNGHAVTDTYNNADELATVSDWLGHTTTFAYDADGNETTATFPAGTGETDTTTYDYNDAPVSITDSQGSTTLASQTYTRDSHDQVATDAETLQNIAPASNTYYYNATDELTSATGKSFQYDAGGDPTTEDSAANYVYDNSVNNGYYDDGAGELTSTPSNSTLGTGYSALDYDALGERIDSDLVGNLTSYTYDQTGYLTQVSRTAGFGGTPPAISQTNTYDGDGLLQTTTNGSTATQLAWDTQTTSPSLLADNGTSVIYGPEDLPIEQITGGGTVSYYHHDQQGSTRLLTSASGTVTGSDTYGPYGNRTSGTGATPVLGYDSQYADPNTGLIYLRARWYDPQTAQFLTRDPLETITQEPYAYAGDNPISEADPTGLSGILGTGIGPNLSLGDVGSGLSSAFSNPGQDLEYLAAGACVVVTDGACLAAVAVAFTYNTANNIATAPTLGSFARAEGITIAENALGGGAGLLKAIPGALGAFEVTNAEGVVTFSMLPKTALGNAALNGPGSAAAAALTGLEPSFENAASGASGC